MSICTKFFKFSALAGAVVIALPIFASVSQADRKPARAHNKQVQLGSKTITGVKAPKTTQALDCSIQSHPDCQPGPAEHFFTVEIGE